MTLEQEIEDVLERFFRGEGIEMHRGGGDIFLGIIETSRTVRMVDGNPAEFYTIPENADVEIARLGRLVEELAGIIKAR